MGVSPTTSASAGLSNVGLVYSKGNAVLSMFERYLGPETFQKGVQAYLKKHAWGNATASDLWQALDERQAMGASALRRPVMIARWKGRNIWTAERAAVWTERTA